MNVLNKLDVFIGNNQELFEINQTSGCIKNKRNIDRENTGEKLILEVKAEDRDSGLPAFTKVKTTFFVNGS